MRSDTREIGRRVSNWGRWGDDDQMGTGNLIDDAATRRGVESVVTAERVPLWLPVGSDGPQVGQPARRYNPILTMLTLNERDPFAPGEWVSTDDAVNWPTCAATHIDALCHVSYDGLLYNNVPNTVITASTGAARLGAEHLPALITRAVLLDIPRLRGVDQMPPADSVSAADLDAAAEAGGVTIEPGDAVLVRTGEMQHLLAGDKDRYAKGSGFSSVGLDLSTVEWVHRHQIGAVFTDNYAFENFPPEDWDDTLAVHCLNIRDQGLIQGQNWNLEGLAARCAEDGRITGLLSAVPEPIVGAASTPVAPVVVR